MADEAGEFSEFIGRQTSAGTVVVERSPVSVFAHAVHADDPVFHNVDVAHADGFADVPAPPTFGFSALQHWGKWDELQPAGTSEEGNPMREVMGRLMASGGIVLHGEQEFTYHRSVVSGQRLHYQGVVRDIYRKASGDKTMTFMVIEDSYRDDDGEPVLTSTMNLLHRV